jgi:hypothetical protein
MVTGSTGAGGTGTTFGSIFCPGWIDRASDSGIVVIDREPVPLEFSGTGL